MSHHNPVTDRIIKPHIHPTLFDVILQLPQVAKYDAHLAKSEKAGQRKGFFIGGAVAGAYGERHYSLHG